MRKAVAAVVVETIYNDYPISTSKEKLDNKSRILRCIYESPGVYFKELVRLTGLAQGTFQYHLKILETTNRIKVDRKNGNRPRYYPIEIKEDESRILGYIRNHSSREMILFMLEKESSTFPEILKHIDKSPSTLSWHLKRLSEAGIISIKYRGRLGFYRLKKKESVLELLHKFRFREPERQVLVNRNS